MKEFVEVAVAYFRARQATAVRSGVGGGATTKRSGQGGRSPPLHHHSELRVAKPFYVLGER